LLREEPLGLSPLEDRGLKSADPSRPSGRKQALPGCPDAHAAGAEGVALVATALGLGISRVGQSSRSWNEYRDFLEWCNCKCAVGKGKAVSGLRSPLTRVSPEGFPGLSEVP
jgi:hypothetical protein